MLSRFTELEHRKGNSLGRNVERQEGTKEGLHQETSPSPSCIKIDLSFVLVPQELCPPFLIYARDSQASYFYHAWGTFHLVATFKAFIYKNDSNNGSFRQANWGRDFWQKAFKLYQQSASCSPKQVLVLCYLKGESGFTPQCELV